jgi:integrase
VQGVGSSSLLTPTYLKDEKSSKIIKSLSKLALDRLFVISKLSPKSAKYQKLSLFLFHICNNLFHLCSTFVPCKNIYMKNKAIVRPTFNHKGRIAKNGKAALYVEIYKKGDIRKHIHSGLYIKPDQWDNKNRLVIKHPSQIEYNRILSEHVRKIEDFEFQLFSKGKELNSFDLERFLNSSEQNDMSFLEFWEKESAAIKLKRGTTKEHAYTLSVMKEFTETLLFSDLDYKFIHEFDLFLKKRGLANNTIYKHHQNTKRYIRLAKKLNLIAENPYDNFTSKRVKGKRINLTSEELVTIEDLEIPDSMPIVKLCRDLFLFSCYCGLRFSDVETLHKNHLKYEGKNITIIKEMEKSMDKSEVTLPLYLLFDGKPQLLIEKYLKNSKEEKIFPKVSNQHININLKTIAQMAKINTPLSFHVSRHTFGTLLAEYTQNPYLIMDLMGHADIQTSMIYIHKSKERINKQLRGISWKF